MLPLRPVAAILYRLIGEHPLSNERRKEGEKKRETKRRGPAKKIWNEGAASPGRRLSVLSNFFLVVMLRPRDFPGQQ